MNPRSEQSAYDGEHVATGTARIREGASAPDSPRAAPSTSPAALDRELVRLMAAGDESALGALYDRWAPLIHSLAVRLLRDASECEEVVEETFWQAWRQATRYSDARGAVSTWLTTMARSRALDRVRAQRRIREDVWQEGDSSNPANAPAEDAASDPQLGAEWADRRKIVRSALNELPEEQRRTIEMAYFGGYSQSEIAELTGQPLGTVKTRVRLAMQKLRERLGVLREDGR